MAEDVSLLACKAKDNPAYMAPLWDAVRRLIGLWASKYAQHIALNVKQALIGITQEITEQLLKLQANPGNITFPGFFFLPWKRGETGENRVEIIGLAARL